MFAPPRIFRGFLVIGSMLSLSLLAGCLTRSEPVPTFGGTELYPLTVGTYRIFAVADTTWRLNRPTINTYQLQEVVTDSFPSAATSLGAATITYRVVRSRRAEASQAWVADSVFTLTPLPQSLLQSRGNRRTVELVFPVRAGQIWNRLAFDGQDSIDRIYRRVDETVTLKLPDGRTKGYEHSVRAADTDAQDALYQRVSEQIFVPNVGPVHRRRRNLGTYTRGSAGEQLPDPNFIFEGYTHREVLIEQGRRK